MSTFAGVKLFADQVKKEVSSIDYVLLNAGMMPTTFRLGKEGFEESIEVNTLSTTLLAILLLPWIKVAGKGKAHLGVVTSGLHRGRQHICTKSQILTVTRCRHHHQQIPATRYPNPLQRP